MFVGITNTPRDYAWGSSSAISGLLGTAASGKPEAELWLGAHAGSPSTIVDSAAVGGARNLVDWIAASPEVTLGASLAQSGDTPRLPFLMKILAAGSPLSLQAHPSPERALTGFALENEAGVPIDAADRNYKDPFHKPEIIYALSETFEALCGFRDPAEIRRILDELRALDVASDEPQAGAIDALENRLTGPEALRDVVDWLLRDGRGEDSGEVAWLVERVVELARLAGDLAAGGAVIGFPAELATVRKLAEAYPGDPGIVLSLLLNHVTLRRGEVLFLPAGNIHAYLSGLGVEVMAASDNVLRGGLTPKHIDIDELLDVLDFSPLPVPYLLPTVESAGTAGVSGVSGSPGSPGSPGSAGSAGSAVSPGVSVSPGSPESPATPGVSVYRPAVPDFALVRVEAEAAAPGDVPMRQVTLAGPAIAICTAGGFLVAGGASSTTLKRGEAVYITPDEGTLTFAGAGEIFLATTGA